MKWAFKVYNSLNFDKCIVPCHHYPNQGRELYHPGKLFPASLWSIYDHSLQVITDMISIIWLSFASFRLS